MKAKKQFNKINIFATKFVVTILLLTSISAISLFSLPVSACSYKVGTYEKDFQTPKDMFYIGETVFAKGTSGVYTLLKLRIIDPSDNIVFYSNKSYYEVNCSYFLNESAQTGLWKVQLGLFKCGCWKWSTYYNQISYFSVNKSNFSLSINSDGNGIVVKNPDKAFYEFGDIVNLTAVADDGWIFDSWSGNLSGDNISDSVLIDGDKSVIAHFVKDQFFVNISVVGNGTVVKDPDQIYYSFGSSLNLTAIPESGWVFYKWEGDISGNTNYLNISVYSNLNITAIFINNSYALNIIICPVGSGMVDVHPSGPYIQGDIVNLTAIPNQGAIFDSWSGDLIGKDNPSEIVMDSDKTIIAIFNFKVYNLSIKTQGDGIVLKDPEQVNYTYGSNVNLTAIADSGWVFDHWSGNLSGSNNPVIINMTDNKNITAHFIFSNGNGGNGGGGGNQGSITTRRITNKPPIADAGGPYSGFTNESITFNASNSYDPDHYIKSWFWDFGDGSTDNGEVVTHIFKTSGEYEITLVVTDSNNAKNVDKTVAFISDPNHAPADLDITGPTEGFINIKYTYSVYSTDMEGDRIKYIIDWGDGNKSESIFFPSGKKIKTTKIWSEKGVYKIVVTADDNNSITTNELEITIDEPIPKPGIPEEFNLALIILLIIAFLLLLLLLLYAKKRRKKNQKENNIQN